MLARLLRAASVAALFCASLSAQTASGTILGAIKDSQDAAIPGARVTVTNVASNTSRSFTTDQSGQYTVPYLLPGPYSVSVEAQGFRKANRTGLTLRVDDRLTIDFQLEVGSLTEQVTVNAEATLLETTSNTLGQVVENRRIVDLPLNGREPFSLAQLSPGVLPVPRGQAPMHLGGSIPSINGASNSTSEVLIDGATDTVPRNAAYLLIHTPSVDAVEEFKVETNSLSAEYGKFNGGVISLVTKSGTNTPHGTAYWFHRNSEFDANDFFQNRNGIALGALRRHQAGFTFGGPVYIPKVYNGKNKTFFFTDYEAFREAALNPSTFTVPTALERTGDFSRTVNSAGARVVVYDPMAVTAGSRTPFANNVIPANRISPVTTKLMNFYPAPNNTRVTNNLAIGASRKNTTDTWDTRFDHNFSTAHRILTRLSLQNPRTGEPNFFDNVGNPSNPPLVQRRRSATVQTTHTLSPTLIVNFHYGLTHMFGTRQAWSDGYDITQLGFASNYRDAQQVRALPVISVGGFAGIGNGAQNYSTQTGNTFQATASKIRGSHNMKFGFDYRAYYNNQLQNSLAEGSLSFGANFTQGPNPNQASATAGSGLATFLLGYPGGSLRIQPATAYRGSYQAVFAQDDWRISRTLTLNLGLRYEIAWPRTERFDRITVWDPSLPSPIASKVPGLNLRGAMTYRGPGDRRLTEADKNNFGPRVGIAWQPLRNTTVRTGYGVFYGLSPTDASLSGTYADGFTANSGIISSIDGTTPISNIANPYPNGINLPAQKSALGPDLFIGQAVSSLILNFATPYFQQWNFSVQQALGKSWMIQTAYAGGKGTRVTMPAMNINQLTADQQALGTVNQQLVPNPFYGVITDPTSSLSLPTVQRGTLLRPFPQYGGVTADYPSLGSSTYHSFQMKVEKRLSRGFTILGALTTAKSIDDSSTDQYGPTTGIMDVTNLKRERSISPQDVSKRLVFSGVWELPIGKGRALGHNWSRPIELVLGNWQFNAIASFQSGLPLVMSSIGGTRPNRVATGTKVSGRLQDHLNQAFDITAFAVPAAFTYGNSSRTAPDLRWHGMNNFDLSLFKNWKLTEWAKAQFRLEAFNAFNRTQFNTPGTSIGSSSAGVISAQYNVPRQLQLAMKIIF
jgi:hypothetical protein